MQLLMCRPDHYGVEYEINPWMNIKYKPDHETALQQWQTLFHTLQQCGAEIELISHERGWPDMTFTANAALLFQNRMILSHFKYKERQGETPYFKQWFIDHAFDIVETDGLPYFEGAGDALLAGKKLFAGFGFRTEKNFYEADFFHQKQLVYCELVDPYFYHLDTCFCPLNESLAIWYPGAFSQTSQQMMQDNISLIAVSKEEAQQFACNAVVIDQRVVLPAGCPNLEIALEKHHFKAYACNMSEYKKAGGACKCLTLQLN